MLRRLVAALAAAAFLAGGWGTISHVLGSADLERASTQLATYQEAQTAVRIRAGARGRFSAARSGMAAAALARADLNLDRAIAEVQRHAPAEDEGLAAAVRRAHVENARLWPSDRRLAQASALELNERLRAAVTRAKVRTIRAAGADRSTERIALAGMPLATVLMLALLLLPGGRRWPKEQHELRRLTHAALTDSLTGLGNHRAFHEDVKAAIQRRNASGGCFSVLMLDLDGLKQINDTLGHHAGDERIREAGELLRSVVRETDGAYRTGGDEFMALLPGERAFAALNLAQRLNELASRAGSRVSVTIGIAEMVGFESKDALLRQADLALYEGKRSRRKVVVYSPDLDAAAATPSAATASDRRRPVATALARAVDAKDATTRAHSDIVSNLCALIAAELGLDADRVAALRLAGLLHDVGKIGIPDAILRKTGPLDASERDVIQTHTLVGESIVAAAGFLEEATWIRHHHERLDGRGYPHGLRAEQIPLESRVILVADAFEAITAGRSYSQPRSTDEALAELERHAGAQFDGDCVAALRRAIRGVDAAELPAYERLSA